MPLRVPESFSTAETLPIASTAIVTMTATHAKAFPVMRSPPSLDTSLHTWVKRFSFGTREKPTPKGQRNLLLALRGGRDERLLLSYFSRSYLCPALPLPPSLT